jgi:hypothetical protein
MPPVENPPPPSSLRLTTPGSWLPIDLDPRTRTGSLARLVSDRLGDPAGDDAERAAARRELIAALRGFVRDAAETGAVHAAILVEQIAGAPIQLSLMASYAKLPPADEPDGTQPGRPDQGPTQSSTVDIDDPASTGRLATSLADAVGELTDCVLPTGPAVRLVSTPSDPEQLLVQYAVAVPGQDTALVLSFGSPQTARREALLGLSEAIARDARWITR